MISLLFKDKLMKIIQSTLKMIMQSIQYFTKYKILIQLNIIN